MHIAMLEVIELRVRLHCKACEKAVRKALCKTKGVRCVEIDVTLNKISVMGYVDSKRILKVIRKTGTRAELWSSSGLLPYKFSLKHEQEKFSQIPVLDTATKELTMHIVLRKGLTSNADPTLSKVKEMVVRGAYDQTLVFYKQHLHPSTPSALHAIIPIFPSLIKATSLAPSLDFGLQLHCLVLKMGSHSHSIISNSLLSMYAKFSQVEAALLVFNTMTHRDTITWSSLVNCYAQNGYFKEASEMLKEMYTAGFLPKPQLIASIISICGRSGELRLGRQIHALVTADQRIKEELELESEQGIKLKNHVSWTAMVSGCCANGNYDVALHCFRAMLVEGIRPNRVTLLALLPACANLGGAKHAKQLHGYAFRHGFESDFHFSAALVHFYGECGEALRSAKLIFERMTHKDVVMWSTIIRSYSAGGNYSEAIRLFREMQLEGIAPNSVTLCQ
ncbi:Pentatricopeptide repeat-containing protein, mitochondrial [Vitis vinifera]|uniref:Pentatricopeptide repeat-containing protein, mitochondrial n=1 Tax=Vitis vinifera TaxID=29760 RepID=A0A438IBM7_VITVI|nr:Pentatricopeptide repeat-containing protein, mitochondrial [Vitis vinifera]